MFETPSDRVIRRLTTIAGLLAATLVIGTIGFILIEGWHWFDAFYMAVITITTVGYLEVHPLSPAGRVFNSALLIGGVTTMFYIIGIITQTVLELEFNNYFGKRKTRKMIDQLKDHYLVCGFGRVGRAAAAELARTNVPFVVLDRDPDRMERAIKSGYLAVLADCTRDESLRECHIDRARGLISALSSDAENLFVILSAKSLNPLLNVATRGAEEEAESKMRRAGADAVFLPYSMTGYSLAQAILRPHVFEFLDVTASTRMGLNIGIEQVRMETSSPFAGRSLRDLQIRREIGVIVLAIRRADGSMQFNPAAECAVQGGDVLIVMGGSEDVRKLETLLLQGAPA